MDGLHARAVHEDLELGTRQRQIRNAARIQLERHVRFRFAGRIVLIEVRSQRGLDEIEVRAQDAVFVQAHHCVERRAGLRDELVRLALGGPGASRAGIEARLEQFDQVACNGRIRAQRAFHVRLAERHSGLQQVAAIRAQYDDLPDQQSGGEQQPVEAVILHFSRPGGGESLAKGDLHAADADLQPLAMLQFEVLDPG